MEYFKTDKNGTKYYMDRRCRRCGGRGGADQWSYTGWTCYKCGGTGIDPNPQIIKEYTEEYAAKLEARREKKAQNELIKKIAKFQSEKEQEILKLGFVKEDNEYAIYRAIGNTFEIKDELKANGYKFRPEVGWFTNNPTSTKILHQRMTSKELLQENPTSITWKSLEEIEPLLLKVTPKSNWLHNVGDKIEKVLKFKTSYQFETRSFSRWNSTDTTYIYKFMDDSSNIYIWKTGSFMNLEANRKYKVKGTVKENSEYKDEKQTVLTRCKVEEA